MATVYDCENKSNNEVYQEIRKYYEEAYQCIEKALSFDEAGKVDEAMDMYQFALNLLDQALNQPLESPTKPDIEWEKTYAMVQKMRKSRKDVMCRIADSQSRLPPEASVPPPSYDEAMSSASATANHSHSAFNSGITPVQSASSTVNQPYIPGPEYTPHRLSETSNNESQSAYSNLLGELHSMKVAGNREIIYSHNNVRLYFIAPDGRVSATSEPDTLIIGRIEDLTHEDVLDDTLLSIIDDLSDKGDEARSSHSRHGSHHRRHHHGHRHHSERKEPTPPDAPGQIYLQVGSWVYALIPGISPVFRADFGAFILPDVHSETEGASVGLILPANADKSVYDLLDNILLGVVKEEDLHSSEHPKSPRRAKRSSHPPRKVESGFANNVVKGANYLAKNLVRGAGNASRFIDASAPRIMSHLNPSTEPQPVNPAVKTTVSVAKTVSGKAATASDFLANKVGGAAKALGQYLAPHVQKAGTKLLTATTKMSTEEAESQMESILKATGGAVQGMATVYAGLESAAAILARSLSNNTVQIIEYKYGHSAGVVAGDTLSTAGNLYDIHGNYKLLKPTRIAKAVAKGATGSSHQEFEGRGPGDGSGFSSSSSTVKQ